MRRIFLGGRSDAPNDFRSMGSIFSSNNNKVAPGNMYNNSYESDDDYDDHHSLQKDNGSNNRNNDNEMRFIEVWDYVGGTSFRGFIADRQLSRGRVEKSLFLFFEHVAGTQLKHGLMALIELASECFACDRLIICLERNAEGLQSLVRDLGWVGFELVTLSRWVQHDIPRKSGPQARCGSFSSVSTTSSVFSEDEVTSEKWLFLEMEV
jgi:oligosaccharide translocation protein RFT1